MLYTAQPTINDPRAANGVKYLMNDETITFLRAFCSKVKEMASLCDSFLEQESKKKKKSLSAIPETSKPIQNRMIPLSKWNQYHDWPSIAGLRAYAFMRDANGFNQVIRKVGRRLLICEKSFFEWVELQKLESTRK